MLQASGRSSKISTSVLVWFFGIPNKSVAQSPAEPHGNTAKTAGIEILPRVTHHSAPSSFKFERNWDKKEAQNMYDLEERTDTEDLSHWNFLLLVFPDCRITTSLKSAVFLTQSGLLNSSSQKSAGLLKSDWLEWLKTSRMKLSCESEKTVNTQRDQRSLPPAGMSSCFSLAVKAARLKLLAASIALKRSLYGEANVSTSTWQW